MAAYLTGIWGTGEGKVSNLVVIGDRLVLEYVPCNSRLARESERGT